MQAPNQRFERTARQRCWRVPSSLRSSAGRLTATFTVRFAEEPVPVLSRDRLVVNVPARPGAAICGLAIRCPFWHALRRLPASIDPGKQPRRAPAVGVVLGAELRAQQRLFRAYPCEERRDDERREQHAHSRAKGQGPTERVDQQPQVAGMADNPIDTGRDERMPGLDGDQSAEPTTQHEHRIDS